MDHAARAPERVGDTVAGKYRLTRLLGAGGMGAVYEALHEFTQRRVAVKLMHPGFARSAIAAERFLREAQAPSTIGHAGIVQVLDGGRDRDGSFYLVLELLQGRTLAQAIADRSLDPQQVAEVGLALLEALQAAHEAGFVHRDIKPENVFLIEGDDGIPQLKLLDFGVAGMLSKESNPGLTQAGSVLGTPLYMSPEQAIGRRVDARSDLWSVGAVLYQALSGRAPFGGDSFQALVVSISTDEHLPLSVLCPELPVRLVAVVERALQKDVDERWQTAAEMAEALRKAHEHGRRARGAARVEAAAEPSPRADAAEDTRSPAQAPARAGARGPLLAAALALLGAAGVAFALLPGARPRAVPAQAAPALPATTAEGAGRAVDSQRVDVGQVATTAAPGGAAQKAAPAAPAHAGATHVPTSPASTAAAAAHARPAPSAAPQGLDSDALTAVLRQHDAELQRCYETDVLATLMQPDAGAAPEIAPLHLDVQLEIAASGEVARVTLDGTASPAMRHCATDAIRAWRFPNSAGTTFTRFPIVFQPSIIRR